MSADLDRADGCPAKSGHLRRLGPRCETLEARNTVKKNSGGNKKTIAQFTAQFTAQSSHDTGKKSIEKGNGLSRSSLASHKYTTIRLREARRTARIASPVGDARSVIDSLSRAVCVVSRTSNSPSYRCSGTFSASFSNFHVHASLVDGRVGFSASACRLRVWYGLG